MIHFVMKRDAPLGSAKGLTASYAVEGEAVAGARVGLREEPRFRILDHDMPERAFASEPERAHAAGAECWQDRASGRCHWRTGGEIRPTPARCR